MLMLSSSLFTSPCDETEEYIDQIDSVVSDVDGNWNEFGRGQELLKAMRNTGNIVVRQINS